MLKGQHWERASASPSSLSLSATSKFTGCTGGNAVTSPTKDEDRDEPRIAPVSDKTSVLRWSGEVPAQKWMNFYTKVLSRFATSKSLRLTVAVDVAPEGGVSKQSIEETKTALRELGLKDDLLQ